MDKDFSNYFMYDGVKWRIDQVSTNNYNLGNNGTPFVGGSNVDRLTDHIKVKAFLVDEWVINREEEYLKSIIPPTETKK